MTNRREFTVHDFRALIEAKNAAFFGDFMRSGIGVEMGPEMRRS